MIKKYGDEKPEDIIRTLTEFTAQSITKHVIKIIKEGKEVDIPTYDFTVHCRSNITKHVVPKKIIIVEGIFALVNKRIRE